MAFSIKNLATAIAILAFTSQTNAQGASGSGVTTRYWDCCKGSCAWAGKAAVSKPITTCDKSDNPLADINAKSGCDAGGSAYMCTNQGPWVINDNLSYGFAAVKLAGGTESSWCCACYQLTFTSGPVAGKQMIVQTTNTGGDLGSNHFDLAIPGGGVGIFNGCTSEFGAPAQGWGAQYGGVSSQSACSGLPQKLQAGCNWRFTWFKGADNPSVTFKQVKCPAEITARSGCVRNDDSSMPAPGSGSTNPPPASSARPATTTTRTSAPATNPTSGGSKPPAAQWTQCGGSGWTGATTCVSPYKCVQVNPYYFQCQ